MATHSTYCACTATTVFLASFVVILVTIPATLGALCRFANKSDTRGSCIFPCRCTKGCNTTTGECLNGGRCIDDHPTGYRWSGPACQIGNIAYHKSATQVSYTWGDKFPAGRAVDGHVDQRRSHEHCALPGRGQGPNAWWQVDLGGEYNILRVDIYSGNNKCKPRHFGAQCQFQCYCLRGETCDDITGKCSSECPSDRWGVGCMLSNAYYYNDPKGFHYKGTLSHGDTGKACLEWTTKVYKSDREFIDGSREAAKNYCRNPENDANTWCYFNSNRGWAWCELQNIRCVAGRFEVNCMMECHCSNVTEDCQGRNGGCQSGCAPYYTGSTCQECKDGYFGKLCDRKCHCSSGVCNKMTDHCPNGCADGWMGDSCQTDRRDHIAFTLSVGNSSNRTSHKQCALHLGEVADGAVVNNSCTAIGRYVSFQRNEGGGHRLTALCEVVVIGHPYISCEHCTSACNTVTGCEECASGKQQPDCKKDCTELYYGVNCQETCGHCKDKSSCDKRTGACDNGCETWYALHVCKTYIGKPTFKSSDQTVVKNITQSSASVTWPKAINISTGLGDNYYYYTVWLKADGEKVKNIRKVAQDSDKSEIEFHITELKFNTNYTVQVQPYRKHHGEQDGGTATEVTKFKTNCKAPVIASMTTSTLDWPANTSTIVSWKAINESGCDSIIDIRVSFKRHVPGEVWKNVAIERVDQTQVTITDLNYEDYDVKLTVTNNEHVSATSEIIITTLATTSTTSRPVKSEAAGALAPGAITGIVFAVIALMVVVIIVAFVMFRRRNYGNGSNAGIPSRLLSRYRRDAGIDNGGLDEEGVEENDGNIGEIRPVEDAHAIYANVDVATHRVAVGRLAAYVEDKRRHNGFRREFEELRSGEYADSKEAHSPENKDKNRFVNIIAYDHTRVVLSEDSGSGDYINANHIMGYEGKENAYIACQGPRDWTIEAMWSMIWQEKTNMVVMLANLYENGKEKCNQYWPEKGKTKSWGHFVTDNSTEETFADYVIREFTLKNETLKKMRKIRQFHFTAWPDKGTPDHAYPLLAFNRKVLSFDSHRRGPLVVHCSAGVGRTGTFIAIDILAKEAAAEGSVDVFECLNLLRTQRISMVQTLDQYVYVYQALIESREVTIVSCSQLKDAFDELCRDKKINKQFQHLNALKPLAKRTHCAALEPSNISKNRVNEIVPDDSHRTYLTTPCKDGNNYINAVYVHGYTERNAHIIAQSPMASTVGDMWRLLADHQSHTVIMLDVEADTDDCATYWPNKKGEKCQYGPFEVELVECNDSDNHNVTMREFSLAKASRSVGDPTIVKQFHLHGGWDKDKSVPTTSSVILDLLDLVEKWQQQSGNGPVTMHCSDGASRCGVLCAASYMLEHMKVEQEVDVFHAVQHVRTTRPQLITDLTQYRFLYELALAYMSQFDTYANFQ